MNAPAPLVTSSACFLLMGLSDAFLSFSCIVLVYLRPRYIRERERRLKTRKLSENRRQQQQRRESNAENAENSEVRSPHAASRCVRFTSRLFWWRIAASVQGHLSAVSQVVREGGLDDEEEDFDNETGFSLAGDLDNIAEESIAEERTDELASIKP